MARKETKHQAIRLADVFLIGPLMVYGGLKGEGVHQAARFSLMLFGLGTIVFNGINWLRIRKAG
jgi:ABC-type sulfate transport system permease component